MVAPTCYILHVCIRNELFMIVGDIAILLHSGMGIKRALCYNFMAALTCFAGLVVGILLGEMTESTSWVLAFAGGMFVYIALVDMVSTTLLCYQYEPNFLFVGFGKQRRPRSNAAECGVSSGSPMFAYRMFY